MKLAIRGVSTRLGSAVAVALCASVLSLSTVGCTPQQQKNVKAVVAKIASYEPELDIVVDTLGTTLAAFAPGEAAAILLTESAFDAALAELKVLCQTYAATPNDGTLASIRATVTTLLNTNATQFLAAAHITNPVSVATAKLAIGGVRTVLLLIDAALQSTQTSAQNATAAQARLLKLRDVEPYLDKHRVEMATGMPFQVVYDYETSLGY